MKKIFVLSMLSIFLVGCEAYQDFLDTVYEPELVENPKDILTATGKIPDDYSIFFEVIYRAANTDCNRRIYWNAIGGTSSNRTKKHKLPVLIENGTYKTELFVDKYKPGKCKWKFGSLYYKLKKEGVDEKFGGNIRYKGVLMSLYNKKGAPIIEKYGVACTVGPYPAQPNNPHWEEGFYCGRPLGFSTSGVNKTGKVEVDFEDITSEEAIRRVKEERYLFGKAYPKIKRKKKSN